MHINMDTLNTGASGSGNGEGQDSGERVNDFLTQEKVRVGSEVIAVLNESEIVWNAVSEKQTVLHRLYAEQIIVSDKFTEYNVTWRSRDFSTFESLETFYQFTEIDEQIQFLSQFLDEFELKLKRSAQIVKGFIRDMKVHIVSLKESLAAVTGANCIEDLTKVTIPSLSWVHTIPDPEVGMLDDEWNQMQLDARISGFLLQLQNVVNDNQEPSTS